jgi:hypothetical protein
MHAVAVGNDGTTMCHRDIFKDRLIPFQTQDWDDATASNFAPGSASCRKCTANIAAGA